MALGAALMALPAIIGNATVQNPAFLDIVDHVDGWGSKALIVSQFTGNPLAKDLVGLATNLSSYEGNFDNLRVETLTDGITWPNTFSHPPTSAFAPELSSFNGVLAAGGFLVPPKTVGAVTLVLVDPSTGKLANLTKLSKDKGSAWLDGWFYHQADMVDMDGDGNLDVLTARATKPLLGQAGGELVWLRHPSGSSPLAPASLPWEESTLVSGTNAPDVFFERVDLNGDGLWEIVHGSFFSGTGLSVVYTSGDSSPQRWLNSSAVRSVTIDTSISQAFGLTVADLNGDGRKEVMVTNHVDNASLAGVYAFETPADGDFTDPSKWTRHTLASGFPVRIPGPGQAAPGAARSFVPCPGSKSPGRPLIIVAGDGEERVYLLTPVSQSPTAWQYTRTELADCKGTTGAPLVADVDGDGATELFVPCYDIARLFVYSYRGMCQA